MTIGGSRQGTHPRRSLKFIRFAIGFEKKHSHTRQSNLHTGTHARTHMRARAHTESTTHIGTHVYTTAQQKRSSYSSKGCFSKSVAANRVSTVCVASPLVRWTGRWSFFGVGSAIALPPPPNEGARGPKIAVFKGNGLWWRPARAQSPSTQTGDCYGQAPDSAPPSRIGSSCWSDSAWPLPSLPCLPHS